MPDTRQQRLGRWFESLHQNVAEVLRQVRHPVVAGKAMVIITMISQTLGCR